MTVVCAGMTGGCGGMTGGCAGMTGGTGGAPGVNFLLYSEKHCVHIPPRREAVFLHFQ